MAEFAVTVFYGFTSWLSEVGMLQGAWQWVRHPFRYIVSSALLGYVLFMIKFGDEPRELKVRRES